MFDMQINGLKKLYDLYAESSQFVRKDLGVMENLIANAIYEAIDHNASFFNMSLEQSFAKLEKKDDISIQSCINEAYVKYQEAIRDEVITKLYTKSFLNDLTNEKLQAELNKKDTINSGELMTMLYLFLREEEPHQELVDALNLKEEVSAYQRIVSILNLEIKENAILQQIHRDENVDKPTNMSVITMRSAKFHRVSLENHIMDYETALLSLEGLSKKERAKGIQTARLNLLNAISHDIANEIPEGIKRDKYKASIKRLLESKGKAMTLQELFKYMNQYYIYSHTGEYMNDDALFAKEFEECILMVELATGNDTENVKNWKDFIKSKDYLLNYLRVRKKLHDIEKKHTHKEAE